MDPRIVDRIEARLLMQSIPQASQVAIMEIRQDFKRYLTTVDSLRHSTWQHAWNAFLGIPPGQATGTFWYTPMRCAECNGRRHSEKNIMRNLQRTGNPVICGGCGGSGRGQRTRYMVRAILPRTSTAPED